MAARSLIGSKRTAFGRGRGLIVEGGGREKLALGGLRGRLRNEQEWETGKGTVEPGRKSTASGRSDGGGEEGCFCKVNRGLEKGSQSL